MAAPKKKAAATVVAPSPPTDLSVLVEKYIKVRDRKEEIMKKAKEEAAKYDAVLDKIEGILLVTFSEIGTESVSTAAGTAYKSTRTAAQIADWDTTLRFIQERELWGMLERRVSKAAVEQYKGETGELPPGVNWREEIVINIRRAS